MHRCRQTCWLANYAQKCTECGLCSEINYPDVDVALETSLFLLSTIQLYREKQASVFIAPNAA